MMEDIGEDMLIMREDFLGGDPILSEAQMQFIVTELSSSENDEENYFSQLRFQDDLEMILRDLQEMEDFQGETPNWLLQETSGQILPELSEDIFKERLDSLSLPAVSPAEDEERCASDFLRRPSCNQPVKPQPINELTNILSAAQTSRRSPADSRRRNILRPLHGTSSGVYSKIPQYYTDLAPPVSKLGTEDDSDTSACKENVYDKLPSYLTDFVNSQNVDVSPLKHRNRIKSKEDVEIDDKPLKIPKLGNVTEEPKCEEEKKLVDERRVVHVGNIKRGVTREQLYTRFKAFGPIEDIKLHYRDQGDCYAFITFSYTTDAFDAVENGNGNVNEPEYELSLGGRRLFCLQQYADLDSASTRSVEADNEMGKPRSRGSDGHCSLALEHNEETEADDSKKIQRSLKKTCDDFDSLLKAAKENINIKTLK